MEKRLSSWKQIYLSKGGRLTLLKSTFSGLPTYFLSLFTIPQAVATRIERIQRNFLWGTSKDVFKYPLVAWDRVCLLVECSGLGIRMIGLFNKALLGNWLWCFGKESNWLWRQVIATKYGEARGGWCTRGIRGSHECGMWSSIKEGIEKFFNQILYNVFGMIHGVGLFLWRNSFLLCLLALYPKKYGSLTW